MPVWWTCSVRRRLRRLPQIPQAAPQTQATKCLKGTPISAVSSSRRARIKHTTTRWPLSPAHRWRLQRLRPQRASISRHPSRRHRPLRLPLLPQRRSTLWTHSRRKTATSPRNSWGSSRVSGPSSPLTHSSGTLVLRPPTRRTSTPSSLRASRMLRERIMVRNVLQWCIAVSLIEEAGFEVQFADCIEALDCRQCRRWIFCFSKNVY
ncbi:hypothetical protein B0H12DRAFT_1117886, partial [Mycena haematopus]